MSGLGAIPPKQKLLSKLLKNSNRQDLTYLSPRRTRSQFKKIDSESNLIKRNNDKVEVSSPFFLSIDKKPKGKKVKTFVDPDSLGRTNLVLDIKNSNISLSLSNVNPDESTNTVKSSVKSVPENEPSTSSLVSDEKYTDKLKRNHIKLEFDQEQNVNLNSKIACTKRKIYTDIQGGIKNENIKEKEIKWEPNHWHKTLENIRLMRSAMSAPVDTMGCHKCADENADEKTKRYHKLVALMLSSQTKDEVTFNAMERLKKNNLIPELVAIMKMDRLQELIYPVSFYKNKAKHLQNTSKILIEKYNSDIPETVDELLKLPGVGPKMAHICMKTAWNITTGIGVDVHVHRIANRLKWVKEPTVNPEKTRIALESWLPSDLWSDVNHLLVGFGQSICTPLNPKCVRCFNKEICPSAFKKIEKKSKKKI